MKKSIFLLLSIVAIIFTSCKKEETYVLRNSVSYDLTFPAPLSSIADYEVTYDDANGATHTELVTNGHFRKALDFRWEGDAVNKSQIAYHTLCVRVKLKVPVSSLPKTMKLFDDKNARYIMSIEGNYSETTEDRGFSGNTSTSSATIYRGGNDLIYADKVKQREVTKDEILELINSQSSKPFLMWTHDVIGHAPSSKFSMNNALFGED